MRDWSKIKAETVFEGIDEDGNRYLSEFLRDYQESFQPDIINAGCRRCLEDYYKKLTLLSLHKMKKVQNSGYRLKKKYEGVSLSFGSAIQVFNSNLSDDLAKQLIEAHPAGKELFEAFPAEAPADQDKTPDVETGSEPAKAPGEDLAVLKKLKRAELDAKASALGIDPSAFSKKEEVAVKIFEVLQATVNE